MTGELGIGLIGSGFMGRCHAMAFRAAAGAFALPLAPRLEAIADLDLETARGMADRFGFRRATTDWRDLLADPRVDLVAITAPNALHREMALAAIAAGKHVYCEKPLALSAAEAAEMAEAAERAGVRTMVGYNYLCNPAVGFVRRLVDDGTLGRVVRFRGISDEDYLADPTAPHSWRCRMADSGSGALGDLGSHVISLALYLAGPIAELSAAVDTVTGARPDPGAPGTLAEVENEDQASALLRFECGALGSIETSRVAWGRKNRLAFEITGTEGTVVFDQERMNEVALYTRDAPADRTGFRTVLVGPAHPDYAAFVPAAGHQLGFNEMKVIEVQRLITAIARDQAAYPDFRVGWEIERVLDAILLSARERRWVAPSSL